MKKTLLLILFISTVAFAHAQEEENDNIQTFFSKPSKIRGYFGSVTNITTLDGESAYMNGFNAAAIFNDHVVFGFYNVNLENNIFSNNDNYIGYEMDFAHRGLLLGYIFMPKSKIHFNTNLLLGKGEIDIYDDIFDTWLEDDVIFVLTPNVEVEFNVVRFLRVGIGVNYRFALDVDKFDNYNNNNFSDLGAFVNLKFGWFR
jgi:hypothetical protein